MVTTPQLIPKYILGVGCPGGIQKSHHLDLVTLIVFAISAKQRSPTRVNDSLTYPMPQGPIYNTPFISMAGDRYS